MTTTPSTSDPFVTDDSGALLAVKLTSNIYGFGHEFRHVLQALMKHGCVPVTRLLTDGNGMIFIYHSSTRRAELWSGSWKHDDPGVYSVANPELRSILRQTFFDFDDLWAFAEGDLTSLELVPGELPVPRAE